MKFFRTNLFFLFFFTFITTTGYAKDVTPAEYNSYWKNTGISLQEFKNVFNNSRCYENEKYFLGCFSVLDTLIGIAKDPLQLVTKDQLATVQGYGDVDQSFSSVLTVKPKKYDTGVFMNDFKAREVDLRAQTKFRLALFKSGEPDFEKIFETYFTRVSSQSPLLEYGTIGALLSSYIEKAIDPHASIIPQAYAQRMANESSESFFGIGVVVKLAVGKLVVQSLIDGGGALSAGVRAKDIIVEVDGKPTEGLSLDAATSMIKGPRDTVVTLTILRGQSSLKISIKRSQIETKNVEAKVLSDNGLKVGVIKLRSFQFRDSCQKLGESLSFLVGPKGQGIQGLVLDLRGNPGGFVAQAVCIGNYFLSKGRVVVQIKDLKTNTFEKLATQIDGDEQFPLVVLIDSNSASASELISGALQDYGRAILIGDRTFGKGSAQEPTDIGQLPALKGINPSRSLLVMATFARFYRPSGLTNQMVGVTPDLTVYSKPNPTEEEKFSLREENLIPEALPPEGARWVQRRAPYILSVDKCMRASGVADKLFNERQDAANPPDYQLLKAQDALYCMTRPR